MDNFRRSKRSANSGNVDGMMRNRMRHHVPGTAPRAKYSPGSSQAAPVEPRIGNFDRKEGFLPRKTKQIMPDGRSMGRQSQRQSNAIDMELEDIPAKKRRFGRKKQRADRRKSSGGRNWKKMALRSAAGLSVLLLLVGSFLGFKAYMRARQVFQGGGNALALDGEIDPSKLKGEGDGRVNILILGKGGPEQSDGPDLTDTIILASVDPVNKDEAGLLSIPRDLAVKMESGETQKINAVYALTKMSAQSKGKSAEDAEKAGIEAIEKIIENITGVPVNYYTMIDFKAFEQAINAVGGVDIDVKTPITENMLLNGKPYRLNVPTGNQHFDGLRALGYSRCRHCDNRSDFGRSERQREVIVALRDKVFSVGTFSNPVKISQLIDSFGSRVRTNLSMDEITKLYSLGQAIDASKIKSVSLVDEPNVLIVSGSANLGLGSIQVPKAGIYKYDDIRTFVRTTFKDGFIKKENPSIVVLNGTTVSGLATTKANVLKGYGYNVVQVDDAPVKDKPNTILVDLRDGEKKYTKRYLELRYKTTATTTLPDGITPPEGADFVIILGQNETSSR